MSKGFGIERKPVMYNDFIIVGPAGDPAGIKGMKVRKRGLRQDRRLQSPVLHPGRQIRHQSKELAIWKAANITPTGHWYLKTGQGMGETLTIGDQKGGYTLTDRATWLAKKGSLKNLRFWWRVTKPCSTSTM